jgi:molybdate transport system substrate-binding protein
MDMMSFSRRMILGLLLVLLWAPCPAGAAESLRVAVASDFMQPFREIAGAFQAETGTAVEATYASSGMLYDRILGEASFDLFLSADEDRPTFLFQVEMAERPFVYAKGRVVLWSSRKDFCLAGSWKEALGEAGVKRISLANPATATYGFAAMAVLETASLQKTLKSRLVFAQDINQAFRYASTGVADACFCAMSCLATEEGRAGCHYELGEASEVIQSACVLRRTKKRELSRRFAGFLLSPQAAAIKSRYGYR